MEKEARLDIPLRKRIKILFFNPQYKTCITYEFFLLEVVTNALTKLRLSKIENSTGETEGLNL